MRFEAYSLSPRSAANGGFTQAERSPAGTTSACARRASASPRRRPGSRATRIGRRGSRPVTTYGIPAQPSSRAKTSITGRVIPGGFELSRRRISTSSFTSGLSIAAAASRSRRRTGTPAWRHTRSARQQPDGRGHDGGPAVERQTAPGIARKRTHAAAVPRRRRAQASAKSGGRHGGDQRAHLHPARLRPQREDVPAGRNPDSREAERHRNDGGPAPVERRVLDRLANAPEHQERLARAVDLDVHREPRGPVPKPEDAAGAGRDRKPGQRDVDVRRCRVGAVLEEPLEDGRGVVRGHDARREPERRHRVRDPQQARPVTPVRSALARENRGGTRGADDPKRQRVRRRDRAAEEAHPLEDFDRQGQVVVLLEDVAGAEERGVRGKQRRPRRDGSTRRGPACRRPARVRRDPGGRCAAAARRRPDGVRARGAREAATGRIRPPRARARGPSARGRRASRARGAAGRRGAPAGKAIASSRASPSAASVASPKPASVAWRSG